MEMTLSIRILVKIKQSKSRLKLASYLFFKRMRKLHAGILALKLPPLLLIS